VTVRFKVGRKTIVLRQVKVNRHCRFRARVQMKGRQRHHARFRITVHFLGNQVLRPSNARTQLVYIG
jgi:hypothetical protein